MRPFLLDTNVLVALLWPSHTQHEAAVKWFAAKRSRGWATCPVTEAAFVRIVSNPAFSRDAVTPREAAAVLAANMASRDHEFWPDDLPFSKAVAFTGARLVGHQQVTDAYLFGLAIHRGGVLATMDRSIQTLAEASTKTIELIV